MLERAALLGVQRVCAEPGGPVRTYHGFRDGAVDVPQLNLVDTGDRQEPGDEGANLAGAENEYAMHSATLENTAVEYSERAGQPRAW